MKARGPAGAMRLATQRVTSLVALAALAALSWRGEVAQARTVPRSPFVQAFDEAYRGRFGALDARAGSWRRSSALEPQGRAARVTLLRFTPLEPGCARLLALGADGEHVESIVVNVLPAQAPIAVARSAAASELLTVSVGDVVTWPLTALTAPTFFPSTDCPAVDDTAQRLAAQDWPLRACTLEGPRPRAWRWPALLEEVALRCEFVRAGVDRVRTLVHRFARVTRPGAVQADLAAIAAGPRALAVTQVIESVRGGRGQGVSWAYVPPRRTVRVGDWVTERRDDVEALDDDLIACLHEAESPCRLRPLRR